MKSIKHLRRFLYKSERIPLFLKVRSSKWFITGTVATATFTDIFLYGVIVPVVPFALQSRVGVPQEKAQYWVSVLLAVFGAALLAASPFWGYLADLIPSRRYPLLFGLLVLTGATAMLAVGTSLPLWIVGRVLQGISSAIVWVSGLALLVDTVGSDEVGQYMGYVGASLSLALLLAPLLGGVVFDTSGYQSVFAMCWGLLVLDVLLRVAVVEKKAAVRWLGKAERDEEKPKQEGGVEHTGSVDEEKAMPRPNTIDHQPQHGGIIQVPATHDNSTITTPIPDSAGHGKKRPQITILVLLSSPRLLASLYGGLIQASILTAFDSTLPLRVRHLFGWNLTRRWHDISADYIAQLLWALDWDKKGPRIPATLSFALATPFIILLRLISFDSLPQKVGLCALLFGLGTSLALSLPPILAEMSNVVVQIEKDRPGVFGKKGAFAQAYGLFNLAFAGGCLIGPVWGGLITERAGWGTMTWTLGLLSASTCVPVGLWVGGPLWKGERKVSESTQ